MTQRPMPVVTDALFVTVLVSGVALAAYLFKFPPELVTLITAFGTAVIALGIAWFKTKNSVTPLSDPMLPAGTPIKTSPAEEIPNATVVTDPVAGFDPGG